MSANIDKKQEENAGDGKCGVEKIGRVSVSLGGVENARTPLWKLTALPRLPSWWGGAASPP